MAETIDAHHHFWNYEPVEYGWIADDMEVIRRSFLPADLKNEIERNGIDGVVSVQARGRRRRKRSGFSSSRNSAPTMRSS